MHPYFNCSSLPLYLSQLFSFILFPTLQFHFSIFFPKFSLHYASHLHCFSHLHHDQVELKFSGSLPPQFFPYLD